MCNICSSVCIIKKECDQILCTSCDCPGCVKPEGDEEEEKEEKENNSNASTQ
jgi:hypothetical protein